MSEWQPIETATPKDDEELLVWANGQVYVANFWNGMKPNKEWWVLNEFTIQPTHWMPLPSPPQ